MKHSLQTVPVRFRVGVLLCLSFLFSMVGCGRESEHYSNARELERKLLMRSSAITYADQGYLPVARELEQVPPWSSDYGQSREKLQQIKDARRIQASEVYQLDYLPSRLQDASLASFAPPQLDSRPVQPSRKAAEPAAPSTAAVPSPELAAGDRGTDAEAVAEAAYVKAEPGAQGILTVKVETPALAASEAATKKGAKAGKKAGRVQPVVMYSTSWCGYCRRARSYFTQKKIEFVEKDIEQDSEAAREMMQKVGGRSGVPVIDIDGTIIQGFDVYGIENALARRSK